MTPEEAPKEYLEDKKLCVLAHPIVQTLKLSTANLDELDHSIESLNRDKDAHHRFFEAYFQAVRYTGNEVPPARRTVDLLNTLSKNGCPPGLGIYIQEYGLDIAPELPDLTPLNGDGWNDHLEIFTGAQTWAAIYYLHGNIADVRTDLLWDAEFSFVNALETSLDTDVEVRASRVYLESAQRWMQLCGKQIYDLCRGRSTSSRPNWSNASGIIDRREKWLRTEGHVLEKSRWDYWKNRFAMLVDCSI